MDAMLAAKARALSDSTFWVLSLNVLTRGFTDLGTALASAAALALGAWRVRHGDMSLEALLIVLMAGTEIFRPLRDLRGVLHQGLNGQAAATGINALLDTPVAAPTGSATRRRPWRRRSIRRCCVRLPGRPAGRAYRPDVPRSARASASASSAPAAPANPPSCGCCRGCIRRNAAPSASAAMTCATSTRRRCAA